MEIVLKVKSESLPDRRKSFGFLITAYLKNLETAKTVKTVLKYYIAQCAINEISVN